MFENHRKALASKAVCKRRLRSGHSVAIAAALCRFFYRFFYNNQA